MAALLLGVGPAPRAAGDDIAGVVTSAAGPEAGVWVIAETAGLETTFLTWGRTRAHARVFLG